MGVGTGVGTGVDMGERRRERWLVCRLGREKKKGG